MKIVKKKVTKSGDSKRVPFTIRTIVRRPTTTASSSLSSSRNTSTISSSSSGSRSGPTFIVKKARPLDGSGRRIRLRDSLLARVQGKFKARSTTVAPHSETRTENTTNDKPKVSFSSTTAISTTI